MATPRTIPALEAALQYAAQGWHVFPVHSIKKNGMCSCGATDPAHPGGCKSAGKHPRTLNGHNDASRDESVIRGWWDRWPTAGVAIATGSISNLIVIDIDTDKGGEETYASFLETYGILPPTLEVVTGGGGRHLYFKHPNIPTGGKVGMGPGLDSRGNGGYVVAPPSNHVSGNEYEWRNSDNELADITERWGERLRLSTSKFTQSSGESFVAREGQRNDYLTSAAGALRRLGFSEEAMIQSLTAANDLVCDPPVDDDEIRQIARSVSRYAPETTATVIRGGYSLAPGGMPKERQQLWIGTRRESLKRGVRFLSTMEPPLLFQRGGVLVHVKADLSPKRNHTHRRVGTTTIGVVSDPAILNYLAEADWLKEDSKGEQVICSPPHELAPAIRGLPGWPFEYLNGVTEWPLIHMDGTVHMEPGFDKGSGWFYAPVDNREIVVPVRCDTDAAWKSIRLIFGDFPFKSEDDWAAFLSALLTPLCRHLFAGNTPLIAITAPKAGTGKTLLVDGMGTLLMGHQATKRTISRDEQEERKQLFSINLAGDPIVLLDNVDHEIVSGFLAAMVTAGTMTQRVLGYQEEATVPIFGTWYITGNNLDITGDNVRRVIRIALDSNEERPETRKGFRYPDLLQTIMEYRPILLAALLGMIREYLHVQPPKPVDLEPFGSFEGWSDFVRRIVLWVSGHDPIATRQEFLDHDGGRESDAFFLRLWHDVIGEKPISVSYAIEEARLTESKNAESFLAQFKAIKCLDAKGQPDAGKTSSRFGKIVDGPIGGYIVRRVDARDGGGRQWRVEQKL